MELKTKRLKIIPLTAEQMAVLVDSQEKFECLLGLMPNGVRPDEHLHAAFHEMHELVCHHPSEYLWYTNWQIILRDENKAIGSIGFKGKPNARHEVEVGYGIYDAYQHQGYATEALKAITEWAFSKENVYYIQAKIELGNEASQTLLEKCGFKIICRNEDETLFEKEKPESFWMSTYMCIGIGTGMLFGSSFDQMPIGMCIGLSIGLCIGMALDAKDKENRKRE